MELAGGLKHNIAALRGPKHKIDRALGAFEWPRFQFFERPDPQSAHIIRAGGKECEVASVWRNSGCADEPRLCRGRDFKAHKRNRGRGFGTEVEKFTRQRGDGQRPSRCGPEPRAPSFLS